uniref:Serpentine receptor class gamma n=1 Tax=Strongyloides papillosus TaxID=174720 RepID=A0A0N5C0M2_STREA
MDNFMLIPSEGNESNMMSLDRSNKAEGSRVLRPKKVPSSLIRESFSNRLRRKENKSVHITRNFTRKCLARKENKKRISFENQQKNVVGYDETRSEERIKNIGRNQNINRVKEGRVSRGNTPLGRPKRSRSLVDILSYVVFTFHHRFPNYGILISVYERFSNNQVDVRAFEFLRNFTTIVKLILTLILNLNILTSIIIPMKHKALWNKYLIIILIVTFLIAFALTWPILCDKMCYIPQDTRDINIGFRAKWFSNNAGWYNSFLVMSTLSLIFLILTSIVNSLILYFLIKIKLRYKKIQSRTNLYNQSEKNKYEKEKKFFITALICSIGQLILIVDNYVSGVFSQKKEYDKFYVMVMIFPIVNDITIFPSMWILLFTCKPLRKALCSFKLWRINKISGNHNVFDAGLVNSILGAICRTTKDCGFGNFCSDRKCRKDNCATNQECQEGELCFFGRVDTQYKKACFPFDIESTVQINSLQLCPGGGTPIKTKGNIYETCDYTNVCSGSGICNPNYGICCTKIRTCPIPSKPLINSQNRKPLICQLRGLPSISCPIGSICHNVTGFCCSSEDPQFPNIVINIKEYSYSLVGETCSKEKGCGTGASCECSKGVNCKCVCIKEMGYSVDSTGKHCKRTRRRLQERCTTDVECSSAFSQCIMNKCTCKPGFEKDSNGGCIPTNYSCLNDAKPLKDDKDRIQSCTTYSTRSTYYTGFYPESTKLDDNYLIDVIERNNIPMYSEPVIDRGPINLTKFEFDDYEELNNIVVRDDIATEDCPDTHYCVPVFDTPKTPNLYQGFCCPKPSKNIPICPVGLPHHSSIGPNFGCANCPFDQYYCHSDPLYGSKDICCPKPCVSPEDVYIDGNCYPIAFYGESCLFDDQCMGRKKLTKIIPPTSLFDMINAMDCIKNICSCPPGWIHEDGACTKLECKVGIKGSPLVNSDGQIMSCNRTSDCSQGSFCDHSIGACCKGNNRCPSGYAETGELCKDRQCSNGNICITTRNRRSKICCVEEN